MCCGHCGKKGECKRTCKLCKDAEYCDEACERKAWGMHQVECNVYNTDNDVALATPYMYQDVASPDVLSQLPENSFIHHSYLTTSHNTDGTVQQRITPSIAGIYNKVTFKKKKNTSMPTEGTFSITLEDLDSGVVAHVDGEMPYDIISLDNIQNPHAERLAGAHLKGPHKEFQAGLEAQTRNSTVLYPNPTAVATAMKSIPIVKDNLYEISVKINDSEPTTQVFKVLLDKSPSNLPPAQLKQLKQSKLGRFNTYMAQQQRQHIAGVAGGTIPRELGPGMSLDTGETFFIQTDKGQWHLTFGYNVMDRPTVTSIKFVSDDNYGGYNGNPHGSLPASYNGGSGGVSTKFVCDSSNVNHVGGLYLALNDRVAQYNDVIDTLKAVNRDPDCKIIKGLEQKNRKYTEQLRELEAFHKKLHEEGPQAAAENPKINTLIASIMEDQYNHIGAKMKESSFAAKILKDGSAAAQDFATRVIEKFKAARETIRQMDEDIKASKAKGGAKEGIKRLKYNTKKGKAVLAKRNAEAEIKDLLAAIANAKDSPLRTDPENESQKMDEIIVQLRDAQKGRTGGVESERGAPEEVPQDIEHRIKQSNWAY